MLLKECGTLQIHEMYLVPKNIPKVYQGPELQVTGMLTGIFSFWAVWAIRAEKEK